MKKPLKYPLGIQTFSAIRQQNYLYLDKTALIYDLINEGKVYFLSRPRRFGKSLLISTFESLFLGQKSLFEGLAIADTDYDFVQYPVVILEFSSVNVEQPDDVKNYIINTCNSIAQTFDIELEIDSYEQRFAELVRKLQSKSQQNVVLLIDEYDKPILDNVSDKQQLQSIKSVLNGFYSAVKALDKYLHFVFITGVSKFAKVSVFSGMNNLTDLSMDRQYATLCGITQTELEASFAPVIESLASAEGLNRSDLLAKIKHWYNGYRFHQNATSIYNPYSLLALFRSQEFKNYWYTTGTPTFLLNLLQDKEYDLKNLSQFEIGESAFAASEPEDMDVLSLFVQTGYLTIKGYNDPLYVLDFPNYEVKKSFYDSVAVRYGHLGQGLGEAYAHQLVQQLRAGDMTIFFTTLRKFFANIPYNLAIDQEKYYQSLFYAVFTLLGLVIDAEVHTNQGRIDCVLQTNDTIYVIEVLLVACSRQTSIRPSMVKKLNDTKEAALKQIEDKQYAQKYHGGDKSVVLLGVEFDQATRNIGEFIEKALV